MGSKPFMYAVQTLEDMQEFANNTVRFLRHFNFDGLDIDWEYPASRGSPPRDKQRFTQLLIVSVSTLFCTIVIKLLTFARLHAVFNIFKSITEKTHFINNYVDCC